MDGGGEKRRKGRKPRAVLLLGGIWLAGLGISLVEMFSKEKEIPLEAEMGWVLDAPFARELDSAIILMDSLLRPVPGVTDEMFQPWDSLQPN